jgi:hypothetical protein
MTPLATGLHDWSRHYWSRTRGIDRNAGEQITGEQTNPRRASRMHLRTPGVGAADRLKFNCQSTDNYLTSTIAVSCEVALESVTSQSN